jgi:hypothetical protein
MQDSDIDTMLLEAAYLNGLEVVIAKHRAILKLPGVHIINPSHDCVMEAIAKALGLDLKRVVCYIQPLD